MYIQILIKRTQRIICPLCTSVTEWTGGKTNETQQDFMCRKCRIYFTINGMSAGEQEELAEEAFM